jgi:hypothetical protein
MPSLLRFLFVLAVIGGIGFGVIFTLATMVQPTPRDITITVPQDRFIKH